MIIVSHRVLLLLVLCLLLLSFGGASSEAIMSEFSMDTVFYGPDQENQFIRIYSPNTSVPVKESLYVVIHGGYWENVWNIDNALIHTLPPFLVQNGHYVCAVEYRRSEHVGGGWPGTNDDIVMALNTLHANQAKYGYNMNKVVLLGHSAGGHLVLWASTSYVAPRLTFQPALCLAIAPVGNLFAAYRNNISTQSLVSYMKGAPPSLVNIDGTSIPIDDVSTVLQILDEDSPFRFASPHLMLPLPVPTIMTVGRRDEHVPPSDIDSFFAIATQAAQSHNARSGASAERLDSVPIPQLVDIADSDHFQMVNASCVAWSEIYLASEAFVQTR